VQHRVAVAQDSLNRSGERACIGSKQRARRNVQRYRRHFVHKAPDVAVCPPPEVFIGNVGHRRDVGGDASPMERRLRKSTLTAPRFAVDGDDPSP
jgi:hypothetical protein